MSAATPGDSVPFEVRCAAFPRGPADSLDPCSASAPTPLAPSPPPTGKASADLRLNAQKTGAFECSGGLFFTTSILNETTAPLRVDTLNITFTKVAGSACSNNAAPVDPQVGMSIPQGISTEIRRVDLAGQLCGPPVGAPGCEWLGKATLFTSFGVLTDEIGFRTVAPTASVPEPAPGPNSTTCGNDHPTVLSPEGGTTVSGTVAVTARLAPDELVCPISLRSFVKAVPSSGGRGGFSGYLDIAPDSYRWNTVSDPNGRYRITAQKACGTTLCGGISDPVTVAVSNP